GRERLTYPVPSQGSFFLPPPDRAHSKRSEFCEELLDALALGLGDYFEKVGAFKTIGVALSGGRDSLLCLLIAKRYVDARGKKPAEILRAFFLPSIFTSSETKAAAEHTA